MECVYVSLLLLVTAISAEGRQSEEDKWTQLKYAGINSPENWGQDFWPSESREPTQGGFELKSFLHPPQAPAMFYPWSFGHESASHRRNPVQTPVHSPRAPASTFSNPPDESLVQTPLSAHVQNHVLTDGQTPVVGLVLNPGQSPLPVYAQNPALTSGLNSVQDPASVTGNKLVLTSDLNSVTWNTVKSPELAPTHHLDWTPVSVPAQPPAQHPVSVPAQPPAQHPVSVPAQPPAQPPVSVPTQPPVSVPTQPPAQPPVSVPTQPPAQPPVSLFAHPPVYVPAQPPAQPPVSSYLDTQLKVQELKKLTWVFPKVPEIPKQPPVHLDWRQPTPANSVAAACGESLVHVEVKQDLFGTGYLVKPSSLTLGGCAAVGQDSSAYVVIFQSELQACGSVITVTEDDLVYSFNLLYTPETHAGTPIVRTGAAVVDIKCHYSRKHNVSSEGLEPKLVPYSSTEVAEQHLVFTLKLMTDDWKFERPSNLYFLGDAIKIEASVMQFNHVPLRIFVDSCVATSVPNADALPRYVFIENHGCLTDARITGSNAHFMQRVQEDKLQFQLEVFKFQHENSSTLFITCSLKASVASNPTDAEYKACSFVSNRWAAADDNDQVCSCCDSNCSLRRAGSLPSDEGLLETQLLLGPIMVKEDLPN